MCLYIQPYDLPFKNGRMTCWKIYLLDYNTRGKPILSSQVMPSYIRKPGIIKSNRRKQELTKYEIEENEVNAGIHVYINKPSGCASYERIVPVICLKKDLVATGYHNEAVFMKVQITKEAWKKAIKEKKS